jgi:hypothetical protein
VLGGLMNQQAAFFTSFFVFPVFRDYRLVSLIRCTLFLFPLWIFIKELIMSPLLLVSFCSGMSATHLHSFLQLNGFQICFVSFSCYSRVMCQVFLVWSHCAFTRKTNEFSILWGRWSGNHPQEDLAKFGYKHDRKVEFF